MTSPLPPDHPPVPLRRVGVLLLNLGTPDATDYWSMRRYLKQFLSDRRVIEVPRPIWWAILNLIILNVRPGKSGRNYDKIWDHARGDSPLRLIAREQAERLQARLGTDDVLVDFAMRYGNPSTADRIAQLKAKGCDRILLLPLYPQYSAPTTATANDAAFDALKAMRWQPAVRTVPAYHDDPAYIAALADSVTAHLKTLDFAPDLLLTSYHGMPRSYLDKGDPYHCQCLKTSRLLAEALGWPREKVRVSFQSRFGNGEWLKPYTDEVLMGLAGEGIRKLAVIAPGFSVDCLETLEELAITGHAQFTNAGGTHFTYVPALNAGAQGMDVIAALVRRELGGWV